MIHLDFPLVARIPVNSAHMLAGCNPLRYGGENWRAPSECPESPNAVFLERIAADEV